MKGLALLSWRHAAHHRGRTLLLAACIAVPIFLPLATRLLLTTYESSLTSRAVDTPLVAGAKGNRFDLTLGALYLRPNELEAIPWGQLRALSAERVTAIPLHLRFTAQGHPVVGTSPEYFELRRLRAASGTLPLMIGDCVLGARVAETLSLVPGDDLYSDQRELYDISVPPALRMRVSGVLAATGAPDDDVVFVDVRTCWILEGLSHGHTDPAVSIDEKLVLGRSAEHVAVSPALIEVASVTPENVASFHVHADEDGLPLTAVIVVPDDDKAATLIKARLNASAAWQMVVPSAVIDDLLAWVLRVRDLFDSFSLVLGVSTVALVVLVLTLSARLRQREMNTLDRIGASRGVVVRLHAIEMGFVVAVSLGLALVGLALVSSLGSELLRALSGVLA